MAHVIRRVSAIGLLFAAATLTIPAPAFADSSATGADVSIAQSLGDRELTFTLRRVTSIPGPLRVDVIRHADNRPGNLLLSVVPTGADTTGARHSAPGAVTSRAALLLAGGPGSSTAVLRVDRPGAWELIADDGSHVTHLPFVAYAQATSPPERAVYVGFTLSGLSLLAGMLMAVRRRGGWQLVPAAGVAAGLAVAVTGAVLSAHLPPPPQPGRQIVATVANGADPYIANPRIGDYSRPPAMLLLDAVRLPASPSAELGLRLVDVATGNPADDLIVHDSALLHLMIVGPDGTLQHLHPARTGAAAFSVTVNATRPGHYAVAAETARLGGGVQLLRSATGFDAVGAARKPAGPVPMTADQYGVVDGTPVQLATGTVVAGTPATVRARIGTTGDLQPWLGMLGHLIVIGPLSGGSDAVGAAAQDAPVWSHAHGMGSQDVMADMDMADGMAMEPMVPMSSATGESLPDETVQAYGPTVGFTYVFPEPGTYRAWIQVERDYTILTVPVLFSVAAP